MDYKDLFLVVDLVLFLGFGFGFIYINNEERLKKELLERNIRLLYGVLVGTIPSKEDIYNEEMAEKMSKYVVQLKDNQQQKH